MGKRMEKEWKKNGTCGQFTSPSFYTETRGPKLWLTVVLLILRHPAGNGASILAKALKQLRCVSVSCARIQAESWGVTIQPDLHHPWTLICVIILYIYIYIYFQKRWDVGLVFPPAKKDQTVAFQGSSFQASARRRQAQVTTAQKSWEKCHHATTDGSLRWSRWDVFKANKWGTVWSNRHEECQVHIPSTLWSI